MDKYDSSISNNNSGIKSESDQKRQEEISNFEIKFLKNRYIINSSHLSNKKEQYYYTI